MENKTLNENHEELVNSEKQEKDLVNRIHVLEEDMKIYKAQQQYLLGFIKGIKL